MPLSEPTYDVLCGGVLGGEVSDEYDEHKVLEHELKRGVVLLLVVVVVVVVGFFAPVERDGIGME
jgi:uncharacterized membrane protein YsdA (DUF1294 family)